MNRKVNEAVKAQVDKLWHTTQIYMHPNIHEYAEKLTEKFPGNLKVDKMTSITRGHVYLIRKLDVYVTSFLLRSQVCFFVNSGSEANDLAMFLARHYTKSFDFISLRFV